MRARRFVALAVVLVLVVVGAVSIADTVLSWVTPASPAGPPAQAEKAPAVPESALLATALPFAVDYLSWDTHDRAARQVALERAVAPDVAGDGWDGTGIQTADSPVAIGLARSARDGAVVTVRVRVTPYAPATAAAAPRAEEQPEDAGTNVASGPASGAGPALQPRWLNLAVPLLSRDGRVLVSARPALVGTPQPAADEPALSDGAAGDATYAQETRDTITKLLDAYGSGELEFIRAGGTTFEGLGGAAALGTVTNWRVADFDDGDDASIRVGDVTVTWELPGNSSLACSYRVELKNADGRWYLLSIGAETEEVS
ncbi:conjugative transposon protein TcpC [Pseudonocardia kunmingensis]|uniref:Conjugative transposon protein TcpC n=1 Tax=Pseudonocardia kunmingensis TaxID=630975 RepID=A0A543CX33_9PSEU|nr:conjugative transposon protein TcpC [Pseudonocardia kunmingensis]